jgi:hypothetical protein
MPREPVDHRFLRAHDHKTPFRQKFFPIKYKTRKKKRQGEQKIAAFRRTAILYFSPLLP